MMRRNPLPKDWNLSTSGDKFDRGRVLVFPFGGSMNQNLDGEALRDMTFIRVNLRGSSFRGADLTGTRFFNCDLRSCDFTNAILDRAVFADVQVERAIFDNCSMKYTVMFELSKVPTTSSFNPLHFDKIAAIALGKESIADMDDYNPLLQSQDPEDMMQYAELYLALLSENLDVPEGPMAIATPRYGFAILFLDNLEGFWFGGSFLENVDFGSASLRNADFRSAQIVEGTDMRDADVRGANFEYARFEDPISGSFPTTEVSEVGLSQYLSPEQALEDAVGFIECQSSYCPEGMFLTKKRTRVLLDAEKGELGYVCDDCSLKYPDWVEEGEL
jgi:uncharacterized protein YjbI with pentapeptide repeats